jgi:uncharacterized iron-regulated membrane protein
MTTKKITFKYLIRQVHLILGLASGLVVFIVAVTGSLYVFEEEGRELFQHDFYHVEHPGNARAPFSQMADTVKASGLKKVKMQLLYFTAKKNMPSVLIPTPPKS